MSQRQIELVREDLEDRLAEYEGLFSEIMSEVIEAENEVPQMPESLLAFSGTITNAQINADATAVFVVWLQRRLQAVGGERFTSHGIAMRVPCGDPNVIDAFLPDHPYAEDFPERADDIEFRTRRAEAEIDMAVAKEVCFTECAVRIQCLARSIKADNSYPRGTEIEPWTVSGGWGGNARLAIARKFHEIRRNYLNDRMPADERSMYEAEVRERVVGAEIS